MTTRSLLVSGLVLLILSLLPGAGGARPERLRPGHSYYSDDYVVEGGVHDLQGEKNFEEVYQLYRYYEASYDEAGRVRVFKEYVRGELVRSESYRYQAGGGLIEKRVSRPGQEDEVTGSLPKPETTP